MPRAAAVLFVATLGACGRLGFDAHPSADATGDSIQLPSGLLAWYTMDQLAGQQLVDATGHGHDGTCAPPQCPTPDLGVRGGALRFDGTQVLRAASAPDLEDLTAFTVSAWLQRDPTAAETCPLSKVLGPSSGDSWQLCVIPSGVTSFITTNGGAADFLRPTSSWPAGSWHHIAMMWDGATKTIVFDGNAEATSTFTCAFDTAELVVGGDVDDGQPTTLFAGLIDDVRIYDRVLAPSELSDLATP